ncbi:MAG: hypothetical protein JW816_01950, partial [Candidatus Buchananbacteria bacterium]|nr:hypothetical protein [Candidatus Buchananbacteria bacterium]
MHIVNIGTDKTLVGGPKLGDALARHASYGRFVDQLDVIVYTNKNEGLKKFVISDNVIGHPTNSLAKIFFIFDAVKIFQKINQEKKVDVAVCQDPFVMGLAGVLLKFKYKIKLQVNFHGDFWQNKNWLKEN